MAYILQLHYLQSIKKSDIWVYMKSKCISYNYYYSIFTILGNTCISVVVTFLPFFNHIGYTPIFFPIKPVRLEPGVHVADWTSSVFNGDFCTPSRPLLADTNSERNSLFSGESSSL